MNPSLSSSTLLLAANFAVLGHLQETFLADVEAGASTSPVFDQTSDDIARLASEARSGRSDVATVADRVWGDLAYDYGRSIPLSHVDRKGDVVEIRCDKREFTSLDVVDMYSYLGAMDAALGGGLRMTAEDGREILLRIPLLSRLEEAARNVYGQEAAGWVYVSGEIPRDAVNRLHGHRRQQIALPLFPVYFRQARRVIHPFPFAFHDAYHAVDKAGIHPELLKISVSLFDAISSLPPDVLELPFIETQMHDLSELLHVKSMSFPSFLKWIFSPFEMTVRRFRQSLMPAHERDIFADRCRRYLDLVFSEWIPRLDPDRRASVEPYRANLEIVARDYL